MRRRQWTEESVSAVLDCIAALSNSIDVARNPGAYPIVLSIVFGAFCEIENNRIKKQDCLSEASALSSRLNGTAIHLSHLELIGIDATKHPSDYSPDVWADVEKMEQLGQSILERCIVQDLERGYVS